MLVRIDNLMKMGDINGIFETGTSNELNRIKIIL